MTLRKAVLKKMMRQDLVVWSQNPLHHHSIPLAHSRWQLMDFLQLALKLLLQGHLKCLSFKWEGQGQNHPQQGWYQLLW
jgi:hypothetical protein